MPSKAGKRRVDDPALSLLKARLRGFRSGHKRGKAEGYRAGLLTAQRKCESIHGHLVVRLQKAERQQCVEPMCSEPAPPYCVRHRGDWHARLAGLEQKQGKEKA